MCCTAGWTRGSTDPDLAAAIRTAVPPREYLLPVPPVDPRTDQQLIVLCNRGDHAAFEALYYRHRDFVMRLALRFTRDHDLSLDVLQEVFAYFSGKFPGFVLTCRLTTFLYPVVRHQSLAALRARDRTKADDDLLTGIAARPAAGGAPATGPCEDLLRVLAVLSPAHREVVLMRFVDDLSLEEIAQALGVPLGTVKSRLHHAIGALREDPATRRYFLADPKER